MTETELKIDLDAEAEARLRGRPALTALREGRLATRELVSVYYDTADHALAKARIALRIRKTGRRWLQTVKKSPDRRAGGLFETVELDRPAPGGRLRLDLEDETGLYDEIRALANGAELAPVFETRVRRTTALLRADTGLVELAIDRGEVIAGALSAPLREAELELVEGELGAVFDVARRLFDAGPVRFTREPKSARGLRLAARGVAEEPRRPRKAGTLDYPADATLETAARDILRDCFAQIAENIAVLAESDDPEGPHQLRVGLRRLRSALAAFRPALGSPALDALSAAARDLGREVGRLRDLDVLGGEIVEGARAEGLDEAAADALAAAIAARAAAVRGEVRAALAAPAAVRFLFDLAEFVETRGWLVPADFGQSARLARPIGETAAAILDRRWSKVMKSGRRIEELEPEGLHALRKQLKKLRYAAEMLAPLHSEGRGGKGAARSMKRLKQLQDTFGSLNDAAMAGDALTGDGAPGAGDPAAQRAAGFVLGTSAAGARAARPRLHGRWRKLVKAGPFWT